MLRTWDKQQDEMDEVKAVSLLILPRARHYHTFEKKEMKHAKSSHFLNGWEKKTDDFKWKQQWRNDCVGICRKIRRIFRFVSLRQRRIKWCLDQESRARINMRFDQFDDKVRLKKLSARDLYHLPLSFLIPAAHPPSCSTFNQFIFTATGS